MASGESLAGELSRKTLVLGLRLWVLICVLVGLFILFVLASIVAWTLFGEKNKKKKKSGRKRGSPLLSYRIPSKSREILVDQVAGSARNLGENRGGFADKGTHEQQVHPNERRILAYMVRNTSAEEEILSQCGSICPSERCGSYYSGDEGSVSRNGRSGGSSCGAALVSSSPLVGLPEFSHLGWGHWFTLRDLDSATNHFAMDNILGEGGYGVVYIGQLVNGTQVAVKRLLNNMGQAEKEFRVEVEAIGHVRHKNLVRLLGYCVEGVHRMLVYEYVNNGNLEQWLHGHGSRDGHGCLSWESRIKILSGTAKALSYLHEAIEPKVVHRDIKSSNILISDQFEAKVSDFGLAKLLGSGKSHIATRVMGTFGYVAPEYANTGLLNEKSDVYSFGVLLLEAVAGRDPVDYCRQASEVNLVEWIKLMVGSKRIEEVVDPNLEQRPTTRALKRALLIALKCVDPDPEKRPKMGQVVPMLEVDKFSHREDRRSRSSVMGSMDLQSLKDASNSAELNKVG